MFLWGLGEVGSLMKANIRKPLSEIIIWEFRWGFFFACLFIYIFLHITLPFL